MGRPRKYPLPEASPSPAVAPRAAAGRDDEEGENLDELDTGQLVQYALDNPRVKLTPAMVAALNETWRDVAGADDDAAKALARQVAARLRRASHSELHPDCDRVHLDVPLLRQPDGRMKPVLINRKEFVGPVEVWSCEARTILELVWRAKQVEAARMTEGVPGGQTIDLDTGLVLERARAVQRA
jgi:hypothetical protein